MLPPRLQPPLQHLLVSPPPHLPLVTIVHPRVTPVVAAALRLPCPPPLSSWRMVKSSRRVLLLRRPSLWMSALMPLLTVRMLRMRRSPSEARRTALVPRRTLCKCSDAALGPISPVLWWLPPVVFASCGLVLLMYVSLSRVAPVGLCLRASTVRL